eukprot:gene6233-5267_t
MGVTYGTAHRFNQAIQLDARRHLKDLFILMEDKADAFGPYECDHAAIQGDRLAQMIYLVYVCGAADAAHATNAGYRLALLGQPSMQVPTISFSDDNSCFAETLRNIRSIMAASARVLRPRLLTNDPAKEGELGLTWRRVGGEPRPRALGPAQLQLRDQGSLVPIITLKQHTRNFGYELLIFMTHAWTISRIATIIRA